MVESKIEEIFNDAKTIYFFDIDGVLIRLNLGEYTHYFYDDDMWNSYLLKHDVYNDLKPIKVMQDFIKDKNKEFVYVITKVSNEEEVRQKKNFVLKNYGILPEHVLYVHNDNEKLDRMVDIKSKYQVVPDKNFVMIDDTVSVLNNIMNNSNFSTVHISSFL